MAIDTAEKRRSVAGIAYWLFLGVTPNVAKDAEWRQQSGWGYSGIAASDTPADSDSRYRCNHNSCRGAPRATKRTSGRFPATSSITTRLPSSCASNPTGGEKQNTCDPSALSRPIVFTASSATPGAAPNKKTRSPSATTRLRTSTNTSDPETLSVFNPKNAFAAHTNGIPSSKIRSADSYAARNKAFLS